MLLSKEIDTRYPNYTITNSKDVYDGNNYSFEVTDYRFENTNNSIYSGGINFALPIKLTKNANGEFKFGGKYRSNDKYRKDIREQWKWKGTTALKVTDFKDNSRTINGFQDGHYNLGKAIDTEKFRELFLNNQSATGFTKTDRPDVNSGEPYEANEDVSGMYLLATQTFNKLLILGGIRGEFVSTNCKHQLQWQQPYTK